MSFGMSLRANRGLRIPSTAFDSAAKSPITARGISAPKLASNASITLGSFAAANATLTLAGTSGRMAIAMRWSVVWDLHHVDQVDVGQNRRMM